MRPKKERSDQEGVSRAIPYLVIAVLAFFVGGIAAPSSPFAWDHKINPVQLATLVVTAGVSLAFFRKFEKQKYSDRLRKDALLERLKLVTGKLDKLQAVTEKTAPEYGKIVSSIKQCRIEYLSFCRFAKIIGHVVPMESHTELMTHWKTLWRLLTDTPAATPATADAALSVTSGHVRLSPNRAVVVGQEIEASRQALASIQTDVILSL